MRELRRDWNPIPTIYNPGWKSRRANDPEKAKAAENLVTEWRGKYRTLGEEAVPAAFLATFDDAEGAHSSGPRTSSLYTDLLIELFDNHHDLTDIYSGKLYPTPKAIAEAIQQAKDEFYEWIDLEGDDKKKIPNKYRVTISDAIEELEDLILEDGSPAHDFFIKYRTIDLLWQNGFFYPLDTMPRR